MEEHRWSTLIVRLWHDADGLKIRFMATDRGGRLRSVAVEANVASAAKRFEEWLTAVTAAPRAETSQDDDPSAAAETDDS